jgi:predicted RNA binding protein YcfA (HicA-like mRNA interferase family)
MKRADLIKKITALGAVLSRHGSNHDWYVHHKKGVGQAVPRHNEIKDPLAKAIIKFFS